MKTGEAEMVGVSVGGFFWRFDTDLMEVFVVKLNVSQGFWLYVRFPNALQSSLMQL